MTYGGDGHDDEFSTWRIRHGRSADRVRAMTALRSVSSTSVARSVLRLAAGFGSELRAVSRSSFGGSVRPHEVGVSSSGRREPARRDTARSAAGRSGAVAVLNTPRPKAGVTPGLMRSGPIALSSNTPPLITRRRPRWSDTTRPITRLPSAVPSGAVTACVSPVRAPAQGPYRMSRRDRLCITATVVSAALVWGWTAMSPSGSGEEIRAVIVANGDSLWTIAQHAKPSQEIWSVVDRITELNGLTSSVLTPGQRLMVPADR